MLAIARACSCRRRHALLAVVVALVLAAGTPIARTALAPCHGHGHDGVGDAIAACLAACGSIAAVLAGGTAVRRLLQRPTSLISAAPTAVQTFVATRHAHRCRAGPAQLQVFRL